MEVVTGGALSAMCQCLVTRQFEKTGYAGNLVAQITLEFEKVAEAGSLLLVDRINE